MKTYAPITLDGSEKSLAELVSEEAVQCFEVLIQCPAANVGEVFFGSRGSVRHFIAAGGSANPAAQNLKDIYITGLSGDKVIVSRFSR